MDLQQLNELDFSEAGSWPKSVKVFVLVLVCLAVAGAAYWFDLRHRLDALQQVRDAEAELRQQLVIKQNKAVNLTIYKEQMARIEEASELMFHQLPSRTEVADLLLDITQAGLNAGLTFDLFKPQAEIPRSFYAELPIHIRLRGHYHDFGRFVSAVAALPRIVTIHDLRISPVPDDPQGTLIMELTARTYRYLEPEEQQPEEAAP